MLFLKLLYGEQLDLTNLELVTEIKRLYGELVHYLVVEKSESATYSDVAGASQNFFEKLTALGLEAVIRAKSK